jgi:hypothetical protein
LVIDRHVDDLVGVDAGNELVLLLDCLLREAIVANSFVEECITIRDAELLAEGLGES